MLQNIPNLSQIKNINCVALVLHYIPFNSPSNIPNSMTLERNLIGFDTQLLLKINSSNILQLQAKPKALKFKNISFISNINGGTN